MHLTLQATHLWRRDDNSDFYYFSLIFPRNESFLKKTIDLTSKKMYVLTYNYIQYSVYGRRDYTKANVEVK